MQGKLTEKEGEPEMKKAAQYIPGFALALVIAAIAKAIGAIPMGANQVDSYIGASVIALFIGMTVNRFWKPSPVFLSGIKFTSKKILKFAIILLGASMSVSTILKIGIMPLALRLL